MAEVCKTHDVISFETEEGIEAGQRLWLCRRAAFGAMARLDTDVYIVDGCVPRTQLPEALRRVDGYRRALRSADRQRGARRRRQPAPVDSLQQAPAPATSNGCWRPGREILEACVELGGSITGEHGVGMEKQNEMTLMFTPTELQVMRRIKLAHDPDDLCNPKKIFPLMHAGRGRLMTPSPTALHNRLTALLGAENAWMDEPAIAGYRCGVAASGGRGGAVYGRAGRRASGTRIARKAGRGTVGTWHADAPGIAAGRIRRGSVA